MKRKKRALYGLGIILITICITFIFTDKETLSMELDQIIDSHTKRVPVLLYHHILKDGENTKFRDNDSVISYEQFKKHMMYLRQHGIVTINSDDLYKYMVEDKALPEKCVVITFDDGYLSNEHYAYNIMKDLGMKGDIFLVTSDIQAYPLEFNSEFLPMLDWGRIGSMSDVFTFYSHTDSLHKYIGKKPALEVLKENEIIKDVSKSLSYDDVNGLAFAYPYGAYRKETISALKKCEIEMAYTVKTGYNTKDSDLFKLNRFVITPKTKMSEFERIFERINYIN